VFVGHARCNRRGVMYGDTLTPPAEDPRCAVLLVEDDPAQRALYDRLLRRWGYNTVAVPSSEQAQRALDVEGCEVVVSDVCLGEASGFDLARSVRCSHPEVPVVLMSAQGSAHMRAEAIRWGAAAFVSKSEVDPVLQHAVFDALLWSMHVTASRRAAMRDREVEMRHPSLNDDLTEALLRLRPLWQSVADAQAPWKRIYEAVASSDWTELSDPTALARAAFERGARRELGRRLRDAVGAELARRRDIDTVFLKVSHEDLHDDALLAPSSPIARFAHRIVLDVGDSSHLAHQGHLASRLDALRARGVRVGLYDAAPLRAKTSALPHDVVAIDYGILRLGRAPDRVEHLLRSICDTHHARNIDVLVNGIESWDERLIALRAGADLLQGNVLGRARTLPPPSDA
jgi:CheY-like chemotaxis protein/EAL domain-containing protein (putative c-di-GMP-specific phosphodiesterase class I)